jgi:cytochrome c551/c552
MNKPIGYDETQVSGGFTPAELGGHHMIIKGVREQTSKNGDNMIVVAFDFAKHDKQPGYFAELFESDIRADKKWPFNGTQYILTMDPTDKSKTNRNFKAFITSVEKSNNMIVEWGDKFCEQFAGKKVGGVFGIVEEEYNGEVKQRHRLRWFCEDANVDNAKVPAPKLLKTRPAQEKGKDDFVSIPADAGEVIPF